MEEDGVSPSPERERRPEELPGLVAEGGRAEEEEAGFCWPEEEEVGCLTTYCF